MFFTRLLTVASCLLSVCCLGFVAVGHRHRGDIKGRAELVVLKDRVMETTATTGTGALTLDGALAGYQSFSVIGDDGECYACVHAVDAFGRPTGQWEVFHGTYTASGATLSRDAVLSSSTGSAINFGAGTKHVVLAVPAARHPISGAPQQTGGTFSGTNSVFTVDGPLWADAGSGGEHHFRNAWNNQNVGSVQHTSDGNTFSAWRFLRYDGHEQGAVGVGNPSGGSTFAGAMYIESSEYTRNLAGGTYAPIPIKLVTTGYINGTNGIYLRQEYKSDGDTVIYATSLQTAALTVTRLGNVVVGSTVATDATDGFFRVPSCAGTPTGAAADGSLVRDSVNHKLYMRSGGNWIALN